MLEISFLCKLFISDYQKMKNGTVKFFDATKGFGFIKDNEGEGDYFVHITGTLEPIADGDEVEFELKEGKRGLQATSVRKL